MLDETLFNLSQYDGTGEGGGDSGDASHDSGAEPTKVVYGRNYDDDDTNDNSKGDADNHDADGKDDSINDNADPNKEFDELIKGKYADQYKARMQENIERRLKNYHMTEETNERYQAMMQPLYMKYGLEDGDIDSLEDAIMNDDALFEEKAAELGLDPENYRNAIALEIDNKRKTAELERIQGQQHAQEQVAKWVAEGDELKTMYPNFDLSTEIQNPEFKADLDAGKSVRKAFEAAHLDEILGGAIVKTAEQTAKNVTDNIRARGRRPAENGLGNKPGIIVKKDPSKFDNNDLAEIVRRSKRGARIEF